MIMCCLLPSFCYYLFKRCFSLNRLIAILAAFIDYFQCSTKASVLLQNADIVQIHLMYITALCRVGKICDTVREIVVRYALQCFLLKRHYPFPSFYTQIKKGTSEIQKFSTNLLECKGNVGNRKSFILWPFVMSLSEPHSSQISFDWCSSCRRHVCVCVCLCMPVLMRKLQESPVCGCKLSDGSLQGCRSGDVKCDGTGHRNTAQGERFR